MTSLLHQAVICLLCLFPQTLALNVNSCCIHDFALRRLIWMGMHANRLL